jgi:hypothetical protein
MDRNDLLLNLDKIHTTEMGLERIRRNLRLSEPDVVAWCKVKIGAKGSLIERRGKNWYIGVDGREITVNASSYTIITAHLIGGD